MSVFHGGDGLSSWAGVAPGRHESAGTRKRARTHAGNRYLSRILFQVVLALSKTKAPHDLADFFRKKLPKLGFKKAAVATAHKLLIRLWRMLTNKTPYAPPPPKPLTESQRQRRTKRHVDELRKLGFQVTLDQLAA
jgi:transposase